ncbi:hypothetical protein LEP1GSC103_2265 [Leptospira borgpetersenii serovar Javanica str. UI 09931]|uniref:Uncharacterized protein n=4 Tax=Leptospira borgpetersenii TaxID=174 RepID=A0A0S2IWB6_LEPBO|nr:hypothetical protein LBBP_03769 [Leptospira borgpetersenii serovar Ballum]EKP13086.1 hypothetical protein LEP1GSC128_3887 [Leptospira borgpetersenii str. 200801926]EKQ93764.1 hypothetical protein LEP1GSC101_1770 [Leptospira borgpetersenii str. UI 09149]EKR00215.1 hypothetical protein LEP1GSC121_3566 [Leptospira borgpetersenii serovar Castellonis str. 200801910]EMK11620.1 hypothetical protein LEP1GSC066_2053 [Leptospira sp. serovar Kenya str. Sh9]EMN16744.1 hypothetical protein LEP1GSC056_24
MAKVKQSQRWQRSLSMENTLYLSRYYLPISYKRKLGNLNSKQLKVRQ